MSDISVNMNSMILLSATNYAIWKPRMEDMLILRELYEPLEHVGVKPTEMKTEDWKTMNRKAVALIRQCIGQEVIHHVAQEIDAYALWQKLEGMYQSKTSRNKALMMRRLVNLKLKSGDSVAVHSSEFQNLVNQLSNVGLKFDDELQALLLLSSLPDSWETLVVSLSNSAPGEKLSMEMVTDAIFNENARRKEVGIGYDDERRVLISDGNQGRSQVRGNWNGKGGGNRSQSRSRAVTCYHCHEEGHIKRYCPKLKAKKGDDQSKDTTAVVQEYEDLLLTVSDSTDARKSDWVLDSGCSYHICGDRSQFSEYETFDGGSVRMANDSTNRVVGKGMVKFQMPSGKTVKLTNVRHVQGVKKNLISLGMLDERGYSFSASGGVLRVLDGDRELLRGKMIGGVYRLVGSVVTGGARVRLETSGIGCSVGQGNQLQLRTRDEQAGARVVRYSSSKWKEQLMHGVHEEAQREETVKLGAPMKKKVSFALQLVSGGDFSGVVDMGGGTRSPRSPRQ